MGCPAEDLDVVPGRELMDEAGRHLAFDIHSDARELRLAGVDVQGIHDADVETRDEAVAFLKAKGFSRGEADTLGPAVMAKLGWSKGGGTSGEQREFGLMVSMLPPHTLSSCLRPQRASALCSSHAVAPSRCQPPRSSEAAGPGKPRRSTARRAPPWWQPRPL